MKLTDIISSTTDYTLHSHTQFCDGRSTMAVMTQHAIAAGLKHYGFTPHSPIPFASPCNMQMEDVDTYISEFKNLKSKYSDEINLLLSMEIDFLGEKWNARDPFFDTLPLDYRLSSVHFIPSLTGSGEVDIDGRPASFMRKMSVEFDNDIRYVVDTFYARTLQMIEIGHFDMIGHFDKVGCNASFFRPGIESERWYQRHIDNVVDALSQTDIIVEVNTKSWLPPVGVSAVEADRYASRLYPSAPTIAKLLRAGMTLAVNSDAHYPERVTAGRTEALEIINTLKYGTR